MPRSRGQRPLRSRPIGGLVAAIERDREKLGVVSEGARQAKPINSVDVAKEGIKSLSRVDNTSKRVKAFAERVMRLWGEANTAEVANVFWLNPAHNDAKFFRDAYLRELSTLGYASLADIMGVRPKPSDLVGGLFAPDRKQAAQLCLDRLNVVAGGLEVVAALDARAPMGIDVGTYNDVVWRDRVVERRPFPTRLASYDPQTLSQFAATLPAINFVEVDHRRYQGTQ